MENGSFGWIKEQWKMESFGWIKEQWKIEVWTGLTES